MRRRQQAEDTTTSIQKPLTRTGASIFPFLDISSGNFRISFYIITGAGWKCALWTSESSEEIFSMNFFLLFLLTCAQVPVLGLHEIPITFAHKREIFEWNFCDFPLVASLMLHRASLSMLSRYPILFLFTFWHFKIFPPKRFLQVATCVCSPTTWQSLSWANGKKKSRFPCAPCWKISLSEKLSLFRDELEEKSLREMLRQYDCQSIRQLLHS